MWFSYKTLFQTTVQNVLFLCNTFDRRTSQAYMVEGGVIEWLAGAFHSGAEMSEYARNSSIALLFNLSLCPMGKYRTYHTVHSQEKKLGIQLNK